MIPLILRLKKESHREIAKAQDIIIEELYKTLNSAVLHGGTAIWRCYSGNRFSEDVDAYIPNEKEKIKIFFSNLERRGLVLEKVKITDSSVYSNMKFNRISVRFEATFQNPASMLKEYETVDGNFLTVYTLAPEDFIKEKVPTYLKRLKIRDIYDIFFLLRYIKYKEHVKESMNLLIKNFKPPVDEEDLKVVILEGLIPTSEKIMDYLKRWL